MAGSVRAFTSRIRLSYVCLAVVITVPIATSAGVHVLALEPAESIPVWAVSLAVVASFSLGLDEKVQVVALGLLLPVVAVGNSPPLFWDALRMILALSLVLKHQRFFALTGAPFLTVLVAGVGFSLIGLGKGDLTGFHYGASVLSGLLIAVSVGTRYRILFFTAFVWGALMSAIAVLLDQSLGFVLGQGNQGVTAAGLGGSSTWTGPLLVLAFALVACGLTALSRTAAIIALVVLAVGIAQTGSRGGLVALLIFFSIWLILGLKSSERLFAVGAVVVYLGIGILFEMVAVARLLRLRSAGGDQYFGPDYSSGRTDMNTLAWDALMDQPLFGVDSGMPLGHSLFLTWPGLYGLFGALALCAVLVSLARSLPLAIFVVIVTVAVVEPVGLIVGGSTLPVLLIATTVFRPERNLECRDVFLSHGHSGNRSGADVGHFPLRPNLVGILSKRDSEVNGIISKVRARDFCRLT